jgi:hypothetical protein
LRLTKIQALFDQESWKVKEAVQRRISINIGIEEEARYGGIFPGDYTQVLMIRAQRFAGVQITMRESEKVCVYLTRKYMSSP